MSALADTCSQSLRSFGEDVMFVLGSEIHFSQSVSPSSPSSVTMSSSNSIEARRMGNWYKELIDKDDDPHLSLSNRVCGVVVGTNRLSYQKSLSKMMKKGPQWK